MTIPFCALPTYTKYVNSMTPQLRLLQSICYEGSGEQYRYKLAERYWEDLLIAPVRCFKVGLRRDTQPPPYEDIFAVFHFVNLALPVNVSWDKYLRGKDFAQLRRLGYIDASVGTSAYQWTVRLRHAETCSVALKFRDYLETAEDPK